MMKPLNVIWKPQAKQIRFMQRPEYEALYGGAAGGGKSDALLAEALRQVEIPHYRGLLLRKTFPELADLVDRSFEIYKPAYPGATYNDSKHFWRFPSGAKIYFGMMQHVKDRKKYQGRNFDYIGMDELTHFLLDEYVFMISRNRPNGPGTRVYIRGGTNPGGIGHGWVKQRFIGPAPPFTRLETKYKVRMPDGTIKEIIRDRVFIPATVFDNKVLMENDPDYIAKLAMMPDADRDAFLYGSWDSFEGQVFTEWRNDPEHYGDRINTHVINPFTIPKEWPRYRSFDWGYAKPFSVLWWAVDPNDIPYLYREWYGVAKKDGETVPDTGLRMPPDQVAKRVKELEAQDGQVYGYADPAIWDASSGISIAETFGKEGVHFNRGDNERIPGKMQMHYRLRFDDHGIPSMYVFSSCLEFIRTVPNLVYSQIRVEDVDTAGEDHAYDSARYFLMSRPMGIKPKPDRDPFDPPEYDDQINNFMQYGQ
jgi:hypothetical protein